MKDIDLWQHERCWREQGREIICGVDEAGRGPLAGDVYAAAVVLPFELRIAGLNDSKKLTAPARERLYNEITAKATAYGIASASHHEIDEMNILQATYLAMNRAVDLLSDSLKMHYSKKSEPCRCVDIALIDGNRDAGLAVDSVCIVGGDSKSASIAAASVLAKVSRDRYMTDMAIKYPMYAFEKHKGYGTKLHYEKLREHGHCEIHRITFLKRLLGG